MFFIPEPRVPAKRDMRHAARTPRFNGEPFAEFLRLWGGRAAIENWLQTPHTVHLHRYTAPITEYGRYRPSGPTTHIDESGKIAAIASAETMPGTHDSCYLGLFANGAHVNLGESEDWRHEDRFLTKVLPILADHLR